VAVAVALQEAGLPHDLTPVSFAAAEQTKAPYLAINPKGRVPALETAGTVLTETGAILEYIAAQAPDAGLVPRDPRHAAKMRAVMYYMASTMHVNHAHKMRGARWADHADSHADMATKVRETMTASAAYIEADCLTGPFILGDIVTIGDAYLFAVCRWLEGDGVAIADFPKVAAFLDAMNDRDSVKAVRAAGVIA